MVEACWQKAMIWEKWDCEGCEETERFRLASYTPALTPITQHLLGIKGSPGGGDERLHPGGAISRCCVVASMEAPCCCSSEWSSGAGQKGSM